MDCVQFVRSIDSYLDGRLRGTFLGEFHAHRLACRRCSRAVSMLEAAGDMVAQDRREPTISRGFADRVVFALAAARPDRRIGLTRIASVAAGLAAVVAVVTAALLSRPVSLNLPTVQQGFARTPDTPETRLAAMVAILDDLGIKVPGDAECVVHRSMPSGSQVQTRDTLPDAVDRPTRWTEYRLKGKNDHPAE